MGDVQETRGSRKAAKTQSGLQGWRHCTRSVAKCARKMVSAGAQTRVRGLHAQQEPRLHWGKPGGGQRFLRWRSGYEPLTTGASPRGVVICSVLRWRSELLALLLKAHRDDGNRERFGDCPKWS